MARLVVVAPRQSAVLDSSARAVFHEGLASRSRTSRTFAGSSRLRVEPSEPFRRPRDFHGAARAVAVPRRACDGARVFLRALSPTRSGIETLVSEQPQLSRRDARLQRFSAV